MRGFEPTFTWDDIGKFIVVYKKEETLVKGTRLYDTYKEAKKISNLINQNFGNDEVKVMELGFGRG